MTMPSERRPRGRPKVRDETRKRNNVTIRMRDHLKSKIQQAAASQQRSLSDEIETRLERSVDSEERFGGPEMLAIVNQMAGAFLRGGQLGARACQHPEWTVAEWMADPFCYRAAVHAVIEALGTAQPHRYSSGHPDPAERAQHEELHEMFSRFAGLGLGNVRVHRGEEKK